MRKLLDKYFIYLRYFPAELSCYSVPTTFSALRSGKAKTFNFCTGLGTSDVKNQVFSFLRSFFFFFCWHRIMETNLISTLFSEYVCIKGENLGGVSYITQKPLHTIAKNSHELRLFMYLL